MSHKTFLERKLCRTIKLKRLATNRFFKKKALFLHYSWYAKAAADLGGGYEAATEHYKNKEGAYKARMFRLTAVIGALVLDIESIQRRISDDRER